MPLTDISYLIIQPDYAGNFETDWQSCLDHLTNLIHDERYKIFKLNIFIKSTHFAKFNAKKKLVEAAVQNAFGEECPAFGILSITPEEHLNAAIEVGIIKPGRVKVTYRKHRKWHYTLLEKGAYKELWANGVGFSGTFIRTRAASKKAFEAMHQILRSENMTFNNVVRQWNYIGKILYPGEQNFLFDQHYSVFNNIRFEYYGRYRDVRDFPAATGIGMKYNGVVIDFCAVIQDDDTHVISIKNPRQINPCNYNEKVLITSAIHGQKQKLHPLFDRAKLLTDLEDSRLFVSGTASIIGQETLGIGDVEKQTMVTIENIESLTSSENLVNHYPQVNLRIPDKYKFIRVYVKLASDIPIVKAICTSHYGNIPAIYVESDICRTDLLVEIETELHS